MGVISGDLERSGSKRGVTVMAAEQMGPHVGCATATALHRWRRPKHGGFLDMAMPMA